MILIIGLSFIGVLLLWLLLAPVKLLVSSRQKRAKLLLFGLFSAELYMLNKQPELQLKLLFLRFTSNPLKPRTWKVRNNTKLNYKSIRIVGGNASKNRVLIKRLMCSFTIKKLEADIDTGDFALNAQLIPLTKAVNKNNIHIQINFEDNNAFDVDISNRLVFILLIIVRYHMFNINK